MNLRVVPVSDSYVHQTWPLVKQFIEDTFAEGQDFPEETLSYKVDHVLQFLASKQWLLVVAIDEQAKIHGACTVSFLNYPQHRVAFVTTYGGHFISNDSVMDQFKVLMRSQGATKLQALCRKSMIRLLGRFGFAPRNTMVEVML